VPRNFLGGRDVFPVGASCNGSPRLERLGLVDVCSGDISLSLNGLTLLGRSGDGCLIESTPGGVTFHISGVFAAEGDCKGVLLNDGLAKICAMA
jgi:hypothetical protein